MRAPHNALASAIEHARRYYRRRRDCLGKIGATARREVAIASSHRVAFHEAVASEELEEHDVESERQQRGATTTRGGITHTRIAMDEADLLD